MDMFGGPRQQGSLDPLSHPRLQRTQAMIGEKAKQEITRELAAIAVEQSMLLQQIIGIEEHYEAGLLTHSELVKLTKQCMSRQRELTARTERIYK